VSPSKKLLSILFEYEKPKQTGKNYINLFLQSRQSMGVSPRTLDFYKERLSKFTLAVDYLKGTKQDVEKYLNSIPPNQYGLATRHASFRTLKCFYQWLNTEYGLFNPVFGLAAPIMGKPILPSLEQSEVLTIIEKAQNVRDRAIIALFPESGLRLSELANIKVKDIDWQNRTIRVLGKGRKEAYAPFGELSEKYLGKWLNEYTPNGGNIWGVIHGELFQF
jgi:site-specific recombinase XerD